jgi:hypothetical protein
MKKLITYLAAGLLVVGAQSLMAQSDTNSTPPAKHHAPTAEQQKERQAILKLIGLTPADLKDLSPKESKAKIKEAADKFVADLKAKKDSGTLTAEEQKRLDRVEKFLARKDHKKAQSPANN